MSGGVLWQRTPANGSPLWSQSGKTSLFAWEPDPEALGDPPVSSMTTASFTVPQGLAKTALNFHHAYLLEWYDATNPVTPTPPGEAYYYDGARVDVQQRNANGTWSSVAALPWTNGPDKDVEGYGLGWSGDSHGYGSSEVDLSSLAGKTVRAVFSVFGDDSVALGGWWVDDVRLYGCGPTTPAAPTVAAAAGTRLRGSPGRPRSTRAPASRRTRSPAPTGGPCRSRLPRPAA